MQLLPLSTRLNRLFAFYHHVGESEISTSALAIIVGQKLNRVVDPSIIDEVRSGKRTHFNDDDLAIEICRIMFAGDQSEDPGRYLLGDALDLEVQRLDRLLQLWTLIRDRHIEHFASRVAPNLTLADLDRLIEECADLPDTSASAHRHLELVRT